MLVCVGASFLLTIFLVQSRAFALNREKVRVGVFGLPPYLILGPQGYHVGGADAEILHILAKHFNFDVEWMRTKVWVDTNKLVNNGSAMMGEAARNYCD